jgi:hypothetical protein
MILTAFFLLLDGLENSDDEKGKRDLMHIFKNFNTSPKKNYSFKKPIFRRQLQRTLVPLQERLVLY